MSSTDTSERPSIRTMFTDRLGRYSVRSLQILLVVTLASVAVFALLQIRLVVVPVLIATIIACASVPVIRFLRRFMPPIAAAWVALLGGFLVFGGLITAIVFAVRGQWDDLSSSAVQGFERLRDWVLTLDLPFDLELDDVDFGELGDQAIGFITSSSFGAGAVAGLSTAGEFVTGLVLMIVVLFFFLKDGDRIWAFFIKPFTGHRHARGERIGQTGVRVLGGYLRGTATIAAVDAIGIGIGLAILQVPLALPLAVIVFIGAFVPIVGATAAAILAAVVALVANGPVAMVWVIVIAIAVNQLEGNFLQPVVMGQSLKIHPLVILLALTAGTILGGILGAILSVPIAALAWAIVKDWDRGAPRATVEKRRRWRLVKL